METLKRWASEQLNLNTLDERRVLETAERYDRTSTVLHYGIGLHHGMGSKPQHRPKHLGPKLLQIRKALGLSQSDMLRHLGLEGSFQTARISEYETGAQEPSLWILLAYGRVARVHLEILIDDEATLPDQLPDNFDFDKYKQSSVPPKQAGES